MSTATRALLRAVGQLALVLALTEGLLSDAEQLYRCVRGDELSALWCASLFDPHVLPFTLVGVAATGLAALGWWASLRAGRAWAWIAQGCAVALAAPGAVGLVRGLLVAHDTATGGWGMGMWVWVIDFLARVAPLVGLVLSYRGRPLEVDEPGALGWILGVLAPLVLLGVVYRDLDTVVDLPPLMPLATALGAGACYGVMRRRRVLAGAGRWLPATLILTALLLPEYCWLGWHGWANPTDWVPGQLARDTIAWALALTTVALLAVAVLAVRQSRTRGEHAQRGGGAGLLSRLGDGRWRRRSVAVSRLQRLSVNINHDCARVLRTVKHDRGITTTEAIRRAIGLLGFFERVARPPVGTGRAPVEPTSDYVETVVRRLRAALPGLDADLAPLYTLLVLVKGTDTTPSDVHDARSVWRWGTDAEQPWLVPHDQLPDDVEQLDQPVLDAIHLAAGPGQAPPSQP